MPSPSKTLPPLEPSRGAIRRDHRPPLVPLSYVVFFLAFIAGPEILPPVPIAIFALRVFPRINPLFGINLVERRDIWGFKF